jgi:hypothetical protein
MYRADDFPGRYTRFIRTVIVDDIGLLPVSSDATEGFYRLVDVGYEHRALAVSSTLHSFGFEEIMSKPWPSLLLTGSSTRPTSLVIKLPVCPSHRRPGKTGGHHRGQRGLSPAAQFVQPIRET